MIRLEDIKNDFGSGILAEKDCQSFFTNVRESTREQDITEHWDFCGNYEDHKDIKVDVKAIKKVNREDAYPDDSVHFVEIKNVMGNDGWLYGIADYIAFELRHCFMLVDRPRLVNKILNTPIPEKIHVSERSVNKKTFTYYSRKGRNDLFIMVPTEFLEDDNNIIINKFK